MLRIPARTASCEAAQREEQVNGWTVEQVRTHLIQKNWLKATGSERELQHGQQFTLRDDTKVNAYKSGSVQVQGKPTALKKEAQEFFAAPAPPSAISVSATPGRRVFVVFGHDEAALGELKLILLSFKLEPVILRDLAPAGHTIIEKLISEATQADYACVLLTPDDEGKKRIGDATLRPRARQNVVMELGICIAKLGRKRVALLMKGDLEKPSDIDGLLYLPFRENVKEIETKLAKALGDSGFRISVQDLTG